MILKPFLKNIGERFISWDKKHHKTFGKISLTLLFIAMIVLLIDGILLLLLEFTATC